MKIGLNPELIVEGSGSSFTTNVRTSTPSTTFDER